METLKKRASHLKAFLTELWTLPKIKEWKFLKGMKSVHNSRFIK